jgi:hypothetical protein
MAFASVSGYSNLPNGAFSPVIYSKQVQLAFRKSAVVNAITNNDYFGEIANQGDTVRIMKEPEVTVNEYARGKTIATQDLADSDYQLVVDKSNYFAFKLDDIEEAHSHIDFMALATNRSAYRLADQMDKEVLGYLSGYKLTPAPLVRLLKVKLLTPLTPLFRVRLLMLRLALTNCWLLTSLRKARSATSPRLVQAITRSPLLLV